MFASLVASMVESSSAWVEIPESTGVLLYAALLAKGAGHKYVKRVAKPGGGYRYFYRVQHGGGVHREEHFAVGSAFKYGEGHYHVTAAKGDQVTIRHDETGATKTVSKQKLANLLHARHVEAIQAHAQKLQKDYDQALKTGSKKQAARILAEAKRMGLTLAEREQRKEAARAPRERKRPEVVRSSIEAEEYIRVAREKAQGKYTPEAYKFRSDAAFLAALKAGKTYEEASGAWVKVQPAHMVTTAAADRRDEMAVSFGLLPAQHLEWLQDKAATRELASKMDAAQMTAANLAFSPTATKEQKVKADAAAAKAEALYAEQGEREVKSGRIAREAHHRMRTVEAAPPPAEEAVRVKKKKAEEKARRGGKKAKVESVSTIQEKLMTRAEEDLKKAPKRLRYKEGATRTAWSPGAVGHYQIISLAGVGARVDTDQKGKVVRVRLDVQHAPSFRSVAEATSYVAGAHQHVETRHHAAQEGKAKHTRTHLSDAHEDVLKRHEAHKAHDRAVQTAITQAAPRPDTKKRKYVEDRVKAHYEGKPFRHMGSAIHGSYGRSEKYARSDPWRHVSLPKRPAVEKPTEAEVGLVQASSAVASHLRKEAFKANVGEHLGVEAKGPVWDDIASRYAHGEAPPIEMVVDDYLGKQSNKLKRGDQPPAGSPAYGGSVAGVRVHDLRSKVGRVMAGVRPGKATVEHARHVAAAVLDAVDAVGMRNNLVSAADAHREHAAKQRSLGEEHAEHAADVRALHASIEKKKGLKERVQAKAPHVMSSLKDTAEELATMSTQYAEMSEHAETRASDYAQQAEKAGPLAAMGAGLAELRKYAQQGDRGAIRALEALKEHAPEVHAGRSHEVPGEVGKLPIPKDPVEALRWSKTKMTIEHPQTGEKSQVATTKAGAWAVHGKGSKWNVSDHESGLLAGRFESKQAAQYAVAMLHDRGVGDYTRTPSGLIANEDIARMHAALAEAHEEESKRDPIWKVHKERKSKRKYEEALEAATKGAAKMKGGALSNEGVRRKEHTLASAFKRAKVFASDDATRMNLNGVYVNDDGTQAVATDGHRVAVLPLDTAKVPTKARDTISHAKEGYVIKDTYPSYARVFPKDNDAQKVQFHGKALATVVNAAARRKDGMVHFERRNGNVSVKAMVKDADTPILRPAGSSVDAAAHGEAHKKGDDETWGFNARYLRDALRGMKGHPTLQLTEALGPLKVERPDGEMHVIMPMRL